MSAEAQPFGSRADSGTHDGTERNGAARSHDLPVNGVEPDDVSPPVSKVNGSVTVLDTGRLAALTNRRSIYRATVKPATDRFAAACLLIVLSPLIAAVTIGVRLRLGRGTVFRQQRVGLGGGEFTIYKFRTMAPDRRGGRASKSFGGPDRRMRHKSDDDPRHTPFGRVLRKYSLDELPQLVNVLHGDMSLVGPRPELVDVAVRTGIVDHPRHLVRPGLTGPWQISPARGQLITDGLDLDLEYVATCGPWTDLRLLVLTVPAVWRRTGS